MVLSPRTLSLVVEIEGLVEDNGIEEHGLAATLQTATWTLRMEPWFRPEFPPPHSGGFGVSMWSFAGGYRNKHAHVTLAFLQCWATYSVTFKKTRTAPF